MTQQEVFDRLNMLGYLLYNIDRQISPCEIGGRHKRVRYWDLITTGDYIVTEIVDLAESLHRHAQPYTPDGKKAVESVISLMDAMTGREYMEQNGMIVEKPLDTAEYEPVVEEYFKDIRINGTYLCDMEAGVNVSKGYKANGRTHAVRSDTDGPTSI